MKAPIQECEQAISQGRTPDELIYLMHQQGLSITESIKTYMTIYKVPLGEAKKTVAANPVWSSVIKASEPLHEELTDS